MTAKRQAVALLWGGLALGFAAGCAPRVAPAPTLGRAQAIPATAAKISPADDAWPPLVAAGWSAPEPMPGPINTAGAEDSPYPTHDGQVFLFVFTPDLNTPAEKQLLDGVTGLWSASAIDGTWSEPTRVWLAAPDEPALDGCPFVLGDLLYFCSIRVGNLREIDLYRAALRDGVWMDWQNAGREVNLDLEAGEMHMSASGTEIIFASRRADGFGGFDLWRAQKTANGWSQPENLGSGVNTAADENRPALSPDERELWFDAPSLRGLPGPAVYRSRRTPEGTWGTAEEIVSQLAGEPAFSPDGQMLYFVHHYFTPDMSRMIEADIYQSRRLGPTASP
jgi:hypothetical protein